MKKVYTLLLLITLLSGKTFAQQDPVYSQYMFNPVVLNPAFAGLHDMAMVTAVHRAQWIGLDAGNPQTTTLNFNTSLPLEKMGAGITISNDRYGINNNRSVDLIYSYKIKMVDRSFSMGLQGGFTSYGLDYSGLNLNPAHADDPNFPQTKFREGKANFGFGMLYSTPKYYVGLSAPRILASEVGSVPEQLNRFLPHYYMTAGYIITLANEIKIKPSVLVRAVEGAPMSIDINGSILLDENLWLGMSFRNGNSIMAMGQIQVSNLVKFGYSFDYPLVNEIRQAGGWFGTHELMVNINFSMFDFHAPQTVYY